LALFWSVGLVALSACGDDSLSAPPSPPHQEPQAALPAALPSPEPLPPFDFRRLVLEPDRYRGSTRTCVVRHVGELVVDDDGVSRRRVRCGNRAAGYEIDLRFEETVAEDEYAVSVTSPPTLRWLSVVVEGMSEDGTRGRVAYASSRTVPAPVTPPSEISDPSPGSSRVGLDFSRVATEAGLIGTRQSCAVRAATVIVRRRPSEDVVVTMPVSCTHAGGRSSTELAFTEDTAAHALLVGAGAMAHGVVEGPRRLRVTHVTPPEE